jgi:hypothetical protein
LTEERDMTVINEAPEQTTTAGVVESHGGVRIGQALASGAVIDHRGVRIGRVTADGGVVDHLGVRIGRLRPGR